MGEVPAAETGRESRTEVNCRHWNRLRYTHSGESLSLFAMNWSLGDMMDKMPALAVDRLYDLVWAVVEGCGPNQSLHRLPEPKMVGHHDILAVE